MSHNPITATVRHNTHSCHVTSISKFCVNRHTDTHTRTNTAETVPALLTWLAHRTKDSVGLPCCASAVLLLTFSAKLRVSNTSAAGHRFHQRHVYVIDAGVRGNAVAKQHQLNTTLTAHIQLLVDTYRSRNANFSWSNITAAITIISVLSAQNKEMAPKHFLAVVAWLVIMTLAGIEASNRQRMRLKTRPSDGAALCATNPPSLSVKMSPAMPEAPGVVRCGMACTNDGGCKHFNYVPNESNRCQLYHYRPTTFEVRPHCQHYYQPGQQNF